MARLNIAGRLISEHSLSGAHGGGKAGGEKERERDRTEMMRARVEQEREGWERDVRGY